MFDMNISSAKWKIYDDFRLAFQKPRQATLFKDLVIIHMGTSKVARLLETGYTAALDEDTVASADLGVCVLIKVF